MGGRGASSSRVAAMVGNNALTWAKNQVGSTEYAKDVELGEWKKGSYKCNAFVIRAFNQNTIPEVIGEKPNSLTMGITQTQYRAKDFHEGNVPGLTRVKEPQAGDIATDGKHVGIVSGKGKTISASSRTNTVIESSWGFGSDKYRYYRYTGSESKRKK